MFPWLHPPFFSCWTHPFGRRSQPASNSAGGAGAGGGAEMVSKGCTCRQKSLRQPWRTHRHVAWVRKEVEEQSGCEGCRQAEDALGQSGPPRQGVENAAVLFKVMERAYTSRRLLGAHLKGSQPDVRFSPLLPWHLALSRPLQLLALSRPLQT